MITAGRIGSHHWILWDSLDPSSSVFFHAPVEESPPLPLSRSVIGSPKHPAEARWRPQTSPPAEPAETIFAPPTPPGVGTKNW